MVMDLQSDQKYPSAKCTVQRALMIARKRKINPWKGISKRCMRRVSDGEVVALGNDKRRIKLSPFFSRREETVLDPGLNGQNSTWRGKEVSRGCVCGKGSLVWQNITEPLIHSSFLASGTR